MVVDKDTLSWIVTVPVSDQNCKDAIERANIETLKFALKDKDLTKGKKDSLEIALRRKQK